MRNAIMAAPPEISMASLEDAAQKTGLDWQRLAHDMDDPQIRSRLDANVTLARSIGIDGTPALVIGKELIPGAIDMSELTEAVAAARAAR